MFAGNGPVNSGLVLPPVKQYKQNNTSPGGYDFPGEIYDGALPRKSGLP